MIAEDGVRKPEPEDVLALAIAGDDDMTQSDMDKALCGERLLLTEETR